MSRSSLCLSEHPPAALDKQDSKRRSNNVPRWTYAVSASQQDNYQPRIFLRSCFAHNQDLTSLVATHQHNESLTNGQVPWRSYPIAFTLVELEYSADANAAPRSVLEANQGRCGAIRSVFVNRVASVTFRTAIGRFPSVKGESLRQLPILIER